MDTAIFHDKGGGGGGGGGGDASFFRRRRRGGGGGGSSSGGPSGTTTATTTKAAAVGIGGGSWSSTGDGSSTSSTLRRRLSSTAELLLGKEFTSGGVGNGARPRQSIPLKVKIGYGFGHVLNDMTASLWFTYILVFLGNNVSVSEVNAGIVFLTGQIVDAIFNPIAGMVIDSIEKDGSGGGSTRVNYVIGGSLGVSLTFFCLWWIPSWIDGDDVDSWKKVLWYAIWATVFNICWSFVQVAHFSLVDELAKDVDAKLMLNKIGQVGSALAAVTTFVLARIIFNMGDLSHDDQFQVLVVCVVVIGLFCVAIFTVLLLDVTCESASAAIGAKCKETFVTGSLNGSFDDENATAEKKHLLAVEEEDEVDTAEANDVTDISWKEFFFMPRFYEAIGLYALSRMIMIIVMTFLAPYLAACSDHTTGVQTSALAMVLYHTFFCVTVTAEFFCCPRFGRSGRRYLLVSYIFLAICSGLLTLVIYILDPYLHEDDGIHYIYLPLALCGCVAYYLVATSRTVVNELSGQHSSTFVIGFAGFVEKAVIGAAVIGIQESERRTDDGYWWAISIFPSCTAAVAVLLALLCMASQIKRDEGGGSKKDAGGNVDAAAPRGGRKKDAGAAVVVEEEDAKQAGSGGDRAV